MRSLRALLLLSCSVVPGFAQVATATLFGTVTDSSGAAIVNAKVTVTNPATAVASTIETNQEGYFIFPNLRPGTYNLSAESGGFKRYSQSNILLEVNQRARVDVAMQVGGVTETVEVNSTVSTVDTFSATVKEVVDANRMVDLPLNGRNALQLQALLPGSIQLGAGSAASLIALNTNIVFAVNGARPNQSAYTLDGGLNMDMYNNLPAAFPNPDALQEFSILQNSYSAVNGRNAGAVINMVTKSGTNQLKGTLYNFLRNDKLNTRNFFAARPDPLKRNQFGGTVGAPVLLPGYNGRDRTFIFFATEFTRQRFGQTNSSTIVPTALERQGNFSASPLPAGRFVADPATVTAASTGVPYPNNTLPASLLSPVARRFTDAFMPLPNRSGNIFAYSLSLPTEEDQYTMKLDHSFSDKNKASLRYFYSDYRINFNHSLPAFNSNNNWSTHNVTLQDSHIFTPNIVNNATLTFARNTFIRSPLPTEGAADWAALGCTSCFPLAVNPTDWAINVQNGLGLRVNTAFFSYMQNVQYINTLTITKGKHLFSLGGEIAKMRRNGREFFQVNPQWAFDGQRTNAFYGYADFYAGAPRTVFQNSPLRAWQYKWTPFLYFNDDYRVSRRLTLNLGLRWEPYITVKEKNDELGAFRQGVQSKQWPLAPVGAVYPGDPGVERGIVPHRYANFSPRFGIAWDPKGDGKMSVRGGYGVFFDTLRLVAMNTNSTNQPFSLGLTTFDPFSFTDPYRGQEGVLARLRSYTVAGPQERATRAFIAPVRQNSIDPNFNTGYMQQWNLNVQRELWKNIVATVGYVGSKGTGLMIGQNINPAIFNATATPGNVNARRVYPGFEQIQNTQNSANSTYHSLQMSVNRRFKSGVSVLASYVWSKSLDLASNDGNSGVGNQATNPFNWSLDKGLSDFDVRHRVVTSFLYEIHIFNKRPGLAKTLLGGWQINGILTLQDGLPFTMSAGADRSLAGIGRDRADITGSGPVEIYSNRSRNDQVFRYFNIDRFALPALGTFGTVGRNTLIGPGIINFDTAVFKQFRFAERREIEFRWETFNMANRPNFLNPVAAVTNGQRGRLTSARDPRIMQFGLKLYF